MSSKYIGILIAISLIISLVYYIGYKKNVKLMKTMAETLEKALKPKDQLYTYLGGVLGFSVEYQVEGFKKVLANYRLIPRQSALYLPFMFITSGKDSLQLLFYLKKPLQSEFHLVKKSLLNLTKPKIYNKDKLKRKEIEFDRVKFELLYEQENFDKKFLEFAKRLPKDFLNHIAITTDNNIIYIQLLFYGDKKNSIKDVASAAKTFIKNNFS